MKRVLALLLAAILLLGLLAGCSNNEGTPTDTSSSSDASSGDTAASSDKPYDGVTLNVYGFSAVCCSTVQDELDAFREETGITVNFEQLSNDELASKVAVTMGAGGSDMDVFYYRPWQDLGAYLNNGWLEPLSDYYADDAEYDIDDFMAISLDQATSDGTVYGIPVFAEHYVLYYNKDMFDAAGLEYPDGTWTWEDVVEAAQKLTDADNGVYGISMRGSGYDSVPALIPIIRAYGGDYFDENGVCQLTSDAAYTAIGIYQQLLACCPPGYLSKGWSETSDDFAQGIAAMRIDCDTQFTYAVDPDSSVVADCVGFSSVPYGPVKASGIESGWAMGISAGSKNKDAAWEFIKWATGKDMDVQAAINGNFSARLSTWENEDVLASYPEDLAAAVTAVTDPAVSDGNSLPNITYASEARTVLGEALSLAWEGKPYQEAWEAASAEVQALYDEEFK